MNYRKIFENSWNELVEKTQRGEFSPNQEQDVICMLYHLCLLKMKNPNLIHASSTWNFDIVLRDLRGEKRKEQKLTHCLLAEVKFVLRKSRKSIRLNKAKNDIDKLASERKGDTTIRRVFAIFDKPSCIKEKEINALSQYAKSRNVTVFYGCPTPSL